MDKQSETISIEDWLRLVDKPILKIEEKRGRKAKRKNKTQKKE